MCRNLRKHKENKINTYQKEQQEYIQGQINKIRHLVDDKQLQMA